MPGILGSIPNTAKGNQVNEGPDIKIPPTSNIALYKENTE